MSASTANTIASYTGKKLGSLRSERRWALWTPEELFDHAANGGQELVGVLLNRGRAQNTEWAKFQQAYRALYAPQAMRQRIAGDQGPAQRRLALSAGNGFGQGGGAYRFEAGGGAERWLPMTSGASSPLAPKVPISCVASTGNRMVLALGEVANLPSASTYF